jgi:cellulose synthase/poly-beta-1,6-N-acetylglucosamine synthase-like glycosyltransferase
MILVLSALTGLILAGRRGIAKKPAHLQPASPGRWPSVVLIVPVTGAAPGLPENLTSLLTQDYPDYHVVFVTCDLADPATPVISSLLPHHARARHVLSGPSQSCCQKNHNLLAGLRVFGELGEVLCFCDGNQVASPDWLQALIRPIAVGEALLSGGYHHIIPQDQSLPTLGRAITVLTLYLTKGISWLDQPWGGATAIKGTLFDSLGIRDLWARTAVDDVSLAALLKKANIPIRLVPEVPLSTYLPRQSLSAWRQWLTRQWLYLKFYFPGTWLAAGLAQHLLTALVIGAVIISLFSPGGGIPLRQTCAALAFLIWLSMLGVALRALHPRQTSWGRWLTAYYLALFMASFCHLTTWFTRKILWRGISYRVNRLGRVTEINREERHA